MPRAARGCPGHGLQDLESRRAAQRHRGGLARSRDVGRRDRDSPGCRPRRRPSTPRGSSACGPSTRSGSPTSPRSTARPASPCTTRRDPPCAAPSPISGCSSPTSRVATPAGAQDGAAAPEPAACASHAREGRAQPPDGIPGRRASWPCLDGRLRPWRRRLVGLLLTWVVLSALTAALGLAPDVPVLLAILVAARPAGLARHRPHRAASTSRCGRSSTATSRATREATTSASRTSPLGSRPPTPAERGARASCTTCTCSCRCSSANASTPSTASSPRRSPWAQGVTPPELWDLLVGLPPPDLYRPQRLDPILRRIEQW